MRSWFRIGRRADPKVQLQRVLGDFELPTFPVVAGDVLRMLRDESSTINETAERLAEDPGLTTKVLAVANSTAFSLRHPVRDVGHAVNLLGAAEVEALVLAVVVKGGLNPTEAPGFDPERFWRGAARRATAARALADRAHPATRGESFTAGLLSDMAVPLLAQAHGAKYGAVLDRWRAERSDLAALERDAFGFDHASIAGWIAKSWDLPQHLADALGAHHEPELPPEVPVAIGLVAPLGEDDGHGVDQVLEAAQQRLGLTHAEATEILETAFENAVEIAQRLA